MEGSALEGDFEPFSVFLEKQLSYAGINPSLQAAPGRGHLQVIKRLVTAGASVNAKLSKPRDQTALQAASEGGRLQVVGRLRHAGAAHE